MIDAGDHRRTIEVTATDLSHEGRVRRAAIFDCAMKEMEHIRRGRVVRHYVARTGVMAAMLTVCSAAWWGWRSNQREHQRQAGGMWVEPSDVPSSHDQGMASKVQEPKPHVPEFDVAAGRRDHMASAPIRILTIVNSSSAVEQLNDDDLLTLLSDLNRPTGLIREGNGRVILTSAVTDASLGNRLGVGLVDGEPSRQGS